MKIIKKVILLYLIICSFKTFSQKTRAADRATERNKITILYPEIKLDVNESKNATAFGTSTIKGVLFIREKHKSGFKPLLAPKTYGINTTVTLFPVTSYFQAWYDLRESKENKRTKVYMSEEVFYYRITTSTDYYGRFWFEKMKPGKYFLQAFMDVNYECSRQVLVGTGTNHYGGTTTYLGSENYIKEQSEKM